MIYTLTLNPSLDYIMHCDLKLGETNRSTSEKIYPGGKGINVSLVLARLGMESIAIGVEGGFTGRELLRLLGNQIKTDFVHINQPTRINVKIKGHTETEINGKGISVENADLILPKLKNIKPGDWLVMSGSCHKDIYKAVINGIPKGVKIVLDSTPEVLKNTLDCKPFLVKPNYSELCGYFGCEIDNVAEYAQKLRQEGAANVLVSLGDKGAVFVGENGCVLEIPAIKGTVVNTVGAGDSMVAGFLYKYIEEQNYTSAFKMAVACGSAAAFGEWLANKEDALKYYDEIDL